MIKPDRQTVMQVIGSLMHKPQYLSDSDKYIIEVNDFDSTFDRYIFLAIYNLYKSGAERIHAIDVDNYLQNDAAGAKIVMENKNGIQFLNDCETHCEVGNFTYYYNKLKKFNLLRDLQQEGYDVSEFYAENPLMTDSFDINARFESLTVDDILNKIKGKISVIEKSYLTNAVVQEGKAYDGIRDLIKELKEVPEIGCHLQGDYFNTIVRGGRKGKLYLRSASSGVGKTRSMVGDACYIAYPVRWEDGEWVLSGREPQKVLYVATEQDVDEIQTMILAYLTGINEEKFLYGTFTEEEMPRIEYAIGIMEQYQDYMLTARVPNPCSSVIKNLFRRYNLQHDVENFFYDYIFSSPAMLNEYRDLAIREDVALRLFTTTLKNLANELNSFILTSTQLSNDNNNEEGGFRDYKYIRGSKAIIDLVDLACIMSRPAKQELESLTKAGDVSFEIPNLVTDIFKNRRGRWTQVRIWSRNDLGCCRKKDLFITDTNLKSINNFSIIDFKEQNFVELPEFSQDSFDTSELLNTEESVEEAFGDTKKRVKDVTFDDLLA